MTNFTQKQIEEMLEGISPGPWFYNNDLELIFNSSGGQVYTDRFMLFSDAKLIAAAPDLARQCLEVMTKLQAAEEALSFMLKNTPDEMFCDGALMTREQYKSYIKARFSI